MKDFNKLRREVAWKCFEPHLTEEQLLTAIRILEQGYQLDGAITLISYIKQVCDQFNIGQQKRKALYLQFHEMMQAPFELSGDPLLKLHTLERSISLSAPAIQLDNIGPAATITQEQPQPQIVQPPHTALFILLVSEVMAHCGQTEELFVELNELIKADKKASQEFTVLISQWTANPDTFTWATALAEPILTRLVHLLYTAVCEVLGPVEADQCFHQALAICEKQPEAKHFSPSRFL